MRVFISWSKPRSKAIASALRDWLPNMFESIDLFMSDADIEAGRRWDEEIAGNLDQSRIGILCLTPENVAEPWLLFEAGALAKQVGGSKGKAIPYMYGLEPAHLIGSPLAQLQARKADLEGTFAVVASINREYEKPRPEDRLRAAFNKFWPDLENALLAESIVNGAPPPPTPTEKAMLNELLALAQGQSKELQTTRAVIAYLAGPLVQAASGVGPAAFQLTGFLKALGTMAGWPAAEGLRQVVPPSADRPPYEAPPKNFGAFMNELKGDKKDE